MLRRVLRQIRRLAAMGNKLKKLATNSLNAAESTSSSAAAACRKDQRDEPKTSPAGEQQQQHPEGGAADVQVCMCTPYVASLNLSILDS